ncbi:MAG TPA: hypothetical protein VM076_08925 [Gemmatimonadaceae bacterium]|nr:hypothetical protein [Gemmatimonadaceae bacterium]
MRTARRSYRALLAALSLGIVAVPATSAAQALTPGTRVRVKSPQVVAPVTGNFQGMRRDTVVVIEDGNAGQAWSFTPSTIDKLEVSVGFKGGNKGPMTRWALIGAGGGAVAGWLVATLLESATDSKYNDVLSASLGAAAGAGLGVAYGYRVQEEHWAAVPIPRRVGLVPTRHGIRLGVAAAF